MSQNLRGNTCEAEGARQYMRLDLYFQLSLHPNRLARYDINNVRFVQKKKRDNPAPTCRTSPSLRQSRPSAALQGPRAIAVARAAWIGLTQPESPRHDQKQIRGKGRRRTIGDRNDEVSNTKHTYIAQNDTTTPVDPLLQGHLSLLS